MTFLLYKRAVEISADQKIEAAKKAFARASIAWPTRREIDDELAKRRADEILQDPRDGIRSHSSVEYLIQGEILELVEDEERENFRIARWNHYEISPRGSVSSRLDKELLHRFTPKQNPESPFPPKTNA